MEPRDRAQEAVIAGATSRLRMLGYSLLLTAFAFVQEPGRMVGDTKFDLVVDPARFLARAFTLWDPQAAFGQVQNQAYGYFWPMGPFFLLGDLAGLPGWVVQRLWWSLLLVVAFVGVVKVAQALRVGSPATQVLAGFAYALSPHVITLIGPTSVEAWPTALAPWVLLPLVRGAERGSPRRAAAASALAVAMCGGVNAVAVAAVLPAGAVWLLTRERGPRRRSLMVWWPPLTVLGTLWWSLPLLLLGKYSPPFLDYIENAPITTSTTSLPDVLAGTSDWVAYASPLDWVAGHMLGTTPLLIVDAAVVAALGLAGIARRDNPHGRFLLLSVVAGLVLVTFGYDGPVHGWFAEGRQDLLDGALAPFRNLHKFDAVLRLPLVLGLAHLVAVLVRPRTGTAAELPARLGVSLAAVFSVLGVTTPVLTGQLAPPAAVAEVPPYWRQAADFLARHADDGTALELPAAAFGDYLWGSPHDDILQTLARSPWAVRNIVPLAQPGNVRMLDAVTQAVELGRPDDRLADFLASNGIGYLVVRNDLAPFRTDAPDPVVLHQALDHSPGLRKVAEFGGKVGAKATFRAPNGVRVVNNRGRQASYAAVEIYQVRDGAQPVTAWRAATVPVVSGAPGSRLGTDAAGAPAVLAGDTGGRRFGPAMLTDGLQRREVAFTAVRHNQSATMTATAPWRLGSVEHNHRLYADMDRWQTVEAWRAITGASASSSTAYADSFPPLDRGRSPSAALDGSSDTSFTTASLSGAAGQWWRMDLRAPQRVTSVQIALGRSPRGQIRRLALVTAAGRVVVDAPRAGRSLRYSLPPGRTRFLEVRAVGVRNDGPGAQLVLDEVTLSGLRPVRSLATPARPFARNPVEIVLTRDEVRPACAVVDAATHCDDSWRTASEDGDTLNRTVDVAAAARYRSELEVRARPTVAAQRRLAGSLPVTVTGSRPLSTDLAASPFAAVDKNGGTTWVADPRDAEPYLDLRWQAPAAVGSVDLRMSPTAAASRPTRVRLSDGTRTRVVALDRTGHADFPPLRTTHLRIEILKSQTSYSFEAAGAVALPAGVSEVSLGGVAELDAVGQLSTRLALACGSGPEITVDGRKVPTAVSATLGELMGQRPVPARVCDEPQVSLGPGRARVSVAPSLAFLPERLTLRRASQVAPEEISATPLQWDATERSVRLPARSTPTLLVVNENENAGWRAELDGRSLPAQRVDGWRQGWIVPAGASGTIQLGFAPNGLYRAALLGGAVAALLLAALALLRGRRDSVPPPPLAAVPAGRIDGVVLLLAGGLLAGWLGAGAVAAALAARRSRRIVTRAWWVAGALVATGGGLLALARAGGFEAHSAAAQTFAFLGLVAAVLAASGPAFFRRRNGRSSR